MDLPLRTITKYDRFKMRLVYASYRFNEWLWSKLPIQYGAKCAECDRPVSIWQQATRRCVWFSYSVMETPRKQDTYILCPQCVAAISGTIEMALDPDPNQINSHNQLVAHEIRAERLLNNRNT